MKLSDQKHKESIEYSKSMSDILMRSTVKENSIEMDSTEEQEFIIFMEWKRKLGTLPEA